MTKDHMHDISPPSESNPTDDHKTGDGHDQAHGGFLNSVLGGRAEVIFAVLAGLSLVLGWLGPKFSIISEQFGFGLLLAAYFFGGYFALREAVEKIVKGRLQIDFLMLVAATGAAILGEWAEGAFLLFLFSIGHALENYAMGRARNAVAALADLTPDEALVRRGDKTELVLIENLLVGDVVVVRSNERLPADGFVVKGSSAVNQAPITGESAPVDKVPVDDPEYTANNLDKLTADSRVFAGSINGSGSLDVEVTKLASETTLARVMTMVAEAQTRQSPTQSFTRKFRNYLATPT